VNDLVELVLSQHGGSERWLGAKRISAKVRVHGGFWPFKGQPGLLGYESVVADLKRQRITLKPFGVGRALHFDAGADLVTITDDYTGDVLEELQQPRVSMAGYGEETPWSAAQMGYFISYATWMYLAEPLLFTLPGVQTREIEPWEEDGETWRRLEVTFSPSVPSHSATQIYYFDSVTGLQRRMDYDVEVNGGAQVAHYTSEHHDFDGLFLPTRRRVLRRDGHRVADHSFAAILLDLDKVQLQG
jgi:hypothetical protein